MGPATTYWDGWVNLCETQNKHQIPATVHTHNKWKQQKPQDPKIHPRYANSGNNHIRQTQKLIRLKIKQISFPSNKFVPSRVIYLTDQTKYILQIISNTVTKQKRKVGLLSIFPAGLGYAPVCRDNYFRFFFLFLLKQLFAHSNETLHYHLLLA